MSKNKLRTKLLGIVSEFSVCQRTKEDQTYLLRFGLNLRKIREQKGWTLEYTEEKGWHHWQYLQQIETGKKDIGLLTLKKLAKLYRVPVKDFFDH